MKIFYSTRLSVRSSNAIPDYDNGLSNDKAGAAKNHGVKTGHHWNVNFSTCNVRTLSNNESIPELEQELSQIR